MLSSALRTRYWTVFRLVGGEDLFGYQVDVGGHRAGDAHPGGADDRCVLGASPELLQAPLLEPGRTDPVGAQQGSDGSTVLG